VAIEVWDQMRFVHCPVLPVASQKLARLMTLIVASVALAGSGTTESRLAGKCPGLRVRDADRLSYLYRGTTRLPPN
jgi:hypothetical protein